MEVVVAWLETLFQDGYTQINQDSCQSEQPFCVKIRTQGLSNKNNQY
jgi:deoxyxylulose-5-phosphate synthase